MFGASRATSSKLVVEYKLNPIAVLKELTAETKQQKLRKHTHKHNQFLKYNELSLRWTPLVLALSVSLIKSEERKEPTVGVRLIYRSIHKSLIRNDLNLSDTNLFGAANVRLSPQTRKFS